MKRRSILPLFLAALLAAGFLIGQQLLGDSCATGFDVLGRSVVQAKVGDAQLGRAAATIRSGELLLMLGGTFIGGVVGELVSLRAALWIGIGFAALAFVTIWRSPIAGRLVTARRLRPMRRWISCVRPVSLPADDSRRVRVCVARGSMEYSAVTQPRP